MRPSLLNSKALHIKGFNEIRALAALGVFLHHIELFKKRDALPSLYEINFLRAFIGNLGHNMVALFFVLSGFLITYLLLIEVKTTTRIDLKSFYLRRVLRIWPVYYLVMFIAFLVLPNLVLGNPFFSPQTFYYQLMQKSDYQSAFVWFVLFLSNVGLKIGYQIPGASQSWSVSVEEQFYIFWPIFIKIFKNNLGLFLSSFIVFKLILNLGIGLLSHTNACLLLVAKAIESASFELMAVGALSSYFLFTKQKYFIKFLQNKWVIVLTVVATVLQLFYNTNEFILGVFYALVLAIVFLQQQYIQEMKWFSYLGKVSYGIYMYHPIVIFFVSSLLYRYSPNLSFVMYNLGFYVLSLFGTLALSALSYEYVEKRFLLLKNKFQIVKNTS